MKLLQKKLAPWIVGSTLLVLALDIASVKPVVAQPAAGGPDVAAAGQTKRAGKGKRGGKAKAAAMVTPQMLEKVLGKPLTDDQKKAVSDAAKTYSESVAKAVGLTAAELEDKAKEYRQAQKAAKKAKAA